MSWDNKAIVLGEASQHSSVIFPIFYLSIILKNMSIMKNLKI